MTADTLTDRVRSIAQEVVEEPLYVVDVVVRGRQGSRVVEVFVDSDEQLDVAQLAKASREIDFLIESEDVVSGRYSLNVSSPGVDRPLILSRQFRKNIGRHVAVSFQDLDRRPLQGELVAADEDGFTLASKKNDNQRLTYEEAKEVRVLLPW